MNLIALEAVEHRVAPPPRTLDEALNRLGRYGTHDVTDDDDEDVDARADREQAAAVLELAREKRGAWRRRWRRALEVLHKAFDEVDHLI